MSLEPFCFDAVACPFPQFGDRIEEEAATGIGRLAEQGFRRCEVVGLLAIACQPPQHAGLAAVGGPSCERQGLVEVSSPLSAGGELLERVAMTCRGGLTQQIICCEVCSLPFSAQHCEFVHDKAVVCFEALPGDALRLLVVSRPFPVLRQLREAVEVA
ncbi:hypothetical protein [Streptomyces longwoodensis]|uniref:hypothetical protein n=1 Tax=Streptomyces longwoodensis TaxID=68231 RepID=UPI00384EABF9